METPKEKILITGALGQIGTELTVKKTLSHLDLTNGKKTSRKLAITKDLM